LKKLWLHSVRLYLRIGLFFYYKKVGVVKQETLPHNGPILFLANHQNALLDALSIAVNTDRFCYFLTRAGVFQNTLIHKILHSLQLLPVYRIRDGWANLSNNAAIFEMCSKLFNEGKAIVIFPEGNHNLRRTVRPLSKGFTRIIFQTIERYPNTNLHLVPVGLNYKNALSYGDEAAIYFGKPFFAKSCFQNDKNESIKVLKEKVHHDISQLTTHIPSQIYEETLAELEQLGCQFLNPHKVNEAINTNFITANFKKKKTRNQLKSVFRLALKILLIGPYLLWSFGVKPKITSKEFIATFRFAIGITLVPIWVLCLTILCTIFLGGIVGFYFIVTTLIMALLSVKL